MSRSTLEQKLLFDNIGYNWISSEKLIVQLIPKINPSRARKAFAKFYKPESDRVVSDEYKIYWGAKTLLTKAIEAAQIEDSIQVRKDNNSSHYWIRSNNISASQVDAIISELVVTVKYDSNSSRDNIVINRDNIADSVILSFVTHQEDNSPIKAFNAIMTPTAAIMLADQLQTNSLVYVSDDTVDI